MKYRKDE
jgi:hypothetical protein